MRERPDQVRLANHVRLHVSFSTDPTLRRHKPSRLKLLISSNYITLATTKTTSSFPSIRLPVDLLSSSSASYNSSARFRSPLVL